MGNSHSHLQKRKSRRKELCIPPNIAAIDFGTTSLTLSYSTKGDDEVKTFQFGADKSPRIPNAILFLRGDDEKTKAIALGTEARDKFFKIKEKEKKNYVYFERIKMLLNREKCIDREAHVESFTGEPFYLIEVIAFILKYMANELQDHLSRTVLPLKKNDFDWVITVPNIWDAQSKRMMREAAFLSGMLTDKEGITQLTPVGSGITKPEEENPEKLSLALEPECAAIYSQIISKKEADKYKKAASKDETESVVVKLSKGYMIIDAGGGTVDITIQLEEEGGVKVVTIPMGNPLGGTVINEEFSSKFQDIIGDKEFSEFLTSGDKDNVTKKAAVEKLVYSEFESQKISLGKGLSDDIVVEIPKALMSYYGEERISSNLPDGYEYEDDNIRITEKAAEATLFSESITNLISYTFKALDSDTVERDKIGTIYLVGGFGSSKLVENCVKKALNDRSLKIEVIVPSSPTLAIATGAIMLRKNPAFIKARLADATYGIAIKEIFDPKRHELAYKTYDESDKQYYCRDVFDVFLEKGEEISYNEEFFSTLHAPDGAEEIKLEIFSSAEKSGVKYVRTPEGKPKAESLCLLIIDAPNPDSLPSRDRKIELMINFSGSEIKATAYYSVTKKEVKTVIDFK